MQILKDVYQLCGAPYGFPPSCYAVKGKSSIVLVDTGLDVEQLGVIEENLLYWGLTNLPISHVLATHSHFDHAGNLKHFQDLGAKIVAGPGDAEGIEAGDDRTVGYAYFGKRFDPCTVDLVPSDGQVLEVDDLRFEVLHIPGHTKGSLAFWTVLGGKKVLFTGDSVNTWIECAEARLGWTGGVDYDASAYLQSLNKLRKLEVDVVLGGHFQNCMRNGTKILNDAYRQGLESLR